MWATHLVDEVAGDDALIVLHRGRILAHGTVADVVAQNGGAGVAAAFTQLTRNADLGEAA